MTAPLYMRPREHAAEACERVAARVGRSPYIVRGVLRRMVRHEGTAPVDVPRPATRELFAAMLLEGLVCCDHSSGVWRVTDLGRAGVGP